MRQQWKYLLMGISIIGVLVILLRHHGNLAMSQPHELHPHAAELKTEAGQWKYTNALAKETSPYLLQHAHNPVDWYAWSPEAFDEEVAFLAADTMSNLVWGSLGDRFGFRAVYLGALISSLVGMLLLVLGDGWLVYASFVFLGFGFSGWMMAAVTLVLEFGEHEDIPMRLALTTTVEGGVSSVGPILVGLSIVALGYAPLIVAAFASLLASLALMLWRVREPRTSA